MEKTSNIDNKLTKIKKINWSNKFYLKPRWLAKGPVINAIHGNYYILTSFYEDISLNGDDAPARVKARRELELFKQEEHYLYFAFLSR